MADNLTKKEVYFRLHGKQEFGGHVSAEVFAKKLGELVRAAKAADKSANGGKRHELVISDLKAASAAATMTEMPVSKKHTAESGVNILGQCAGAVNEGRFTIARKYPECVEQLRNLARGSESEYDHGELVINGCKPVRVDQFFLAQSEKAARPDGAGIPQWFKGMAAGSFDGKILEVDLRGAVPKVKLVLTAGGKEIDCVCPDMGSEQLRTVLDRRVRLEGNAYYDGKSGLPSRIEMLHARPIKENADIRPWKGAFDSITQDTWEGDV